MTQQRDLQDRSGAAAVARAFVEARRSGRALADYPGTLPASLDEGYQIQSLALALDGGAVGGWKVGRIADDFLPAFGADRLAGPILERNIVAATAEPGVMPVFNGGFGAAEAEFLLRIGRAPDPAQARFTLEEAAELIDAVHVGIEIASSPFGGINALGPAVTISDFGNNNGLVVGPAVADWRDSAFEQWPVTLRIDGVQSGEGKASAMPGGAFGAARFLFELAASRGLVVKAGQWISSGAVTGVHDVRPGAMVEAGFGGRLNVACRIAATAEA